VTRAREADWLARGWPVALVVAGLTALVFSRSVGYGFVRWDDESLLVKNQAFRSLDWDALRWMASSTLLGHRVPIAWLSFAIDHAVWGMRPAGYHLTNVLLHAANVGLVAVLGAELLRRATSWPERICRLGAAVAALFWGLHPLRVEAVSWVTGRRDVLSGFFLLLTLIAYLRAAGPPGPIRRRWLIAAVAAYALAAGSKAIVMGAPLALLALDVYPLGRLPADVRGWGSPALRGVWLEKIPLIVLGALAALGAAMAVRGVHITLGIEAWFDKVVATLAAPLWRTVWPLSLSPVYERPAHVDLHVPQFWAAVVLIASVSVVILALRARWPAGCVAGIWYVTLLAPVMGTMHVGPQLTADRYSYLPALSFSVLAGALVAAAVRADRSGWIRAGLGARAVLIAIAGLAGLAGLSWRQQGVWQDTGTLWAHAVRETPECARCYQALGAWHASQGRSAEGMANFRRALELNPELLEVRMHFGNLLAAMGRPAEAIEQYERALALDPRRVELHTNLGLALMRLGRPADAVSQYERVLADVPDFVAVRVSLATALVAVGRLPDAVGRLDEAGRFSSPNALLEYFQQLTADAPTLPVPRLGLFQAYTRTGDHVRAREAWEALAGVHPALAQASRAAGTGAGSPVRP
jgi:tetratricopeptide (TPR) repeat protein